jgi:hypothetical protein
MTKVKKVARSKMPNMGTVTVFMDNDVHRQLRSQTALTGDTMSELLENLARFWLTGSKPPAGPWEKAESRLYYRSK